MITNLAKKKKRGFTLVEVIIVLAIIAIIAAIAIPNLTKVRTESKIKADTQSAETIRKTALMLVTDDKIKVPNADKDLYLTFDSSNGKCTGVATAIDNTTGNGTTALTTGEGSILAAGVNAADVVDYFKGIKAPQSDSAKNYKITIRGTTTTTGATSGDIEVAVIKAGGSVVSGIIVK